MRGVWRSGLTGVALAVAGVAGGGAALEAQLVTDRPNFVESSLVVGEGIVQVETSVAFSRGEFVDGFTTPTLVRVGISPAVELRVETPGIVRIGDPVDVTGLADVEIGAKWAFHDGSDGGPTLGALVHAGLPTGSSDVRQDGVRPSLRVVSEWSVASDLSTGVMVGVRSDRLGDNRFTSGLIAASLAKTWSTEFSTYGELAVTQIAEDAVGGDVVFVNAGGLYLLDNDTQLDIALGFGVSDSATDFTVGFGFSKRIGSR